MLAQTRWALTFGLFFFLLHLLFFYTDAGAADANCPSSRTAETVSRRGSSLSAHTIVWTGGDGEEEQEEEDDEDEEDEEPDDVLDPMALARERYYQWKQSERYHAWLQQRARAAEDAEPRSID